MSNCIFCGIIKGEIPSNKIYEDDNMFIFKDIDPKSKIHFIAIPKIHFSCLEDLHNRAGSSLLSNMLKKISEIKNEIGLKDGYRIVINEGSNAGQTVFHLHIHIMGGQKLDFPDLKII